MLKTRHQRTLLGAALASVLTLAACGGGSPTGSPPDQRATRAPASLQMPAGDYAAGQVLSTELLAQSYTNDGAAPVQVACTIKTTTEDTIGGGYSGRMSAGIEVNATLDGVPQLHARVPVDFGSADAPTDALQVAVPPGATVECVSRLAFYAFTAGTKLAPAATLSVSHIQAHLQVLP